MLARSLFAEGADVAHTCAQRTPTFGLHWVLYVSHS